MFKTKTKCTRIAVIQIKTVHPLPFMATNFPFWIFFLNFSCKTYFKALTSDKTENAITQIKVLRQS